MFKSQIAESSEVGVRRAQNVDDLLADALRRLCASSPEIAACYLVDMQRPGIAELSFVIALTVDDEASQMDAVANRFLTMLKQHFPVLVGNTIIMSSVSFVERFGGHEFYQRAASPPATGEPVIISPVDLNQPVENPKLLAAMERFAANQCEQTQQELFGELAAANFLVPFLADEFHATPSSRPGQMTVEEDSLLKIPACADREGRDHLPLFTDWAAIKAWIDQPVSTLVMPAADAWAFILSQPHYAGAFINPAGSRLQLTRELIQYLQDGFPIKL